MTVMTHSDYYGPDQGSGQVTFGPNNKGSGPPHSTHSIRGKGSGLRSQIQGLVTEHGLASHVEAMN